MANLLERSSLVLTPTAYNNGEALCIKPDDASGDFQFSRNSAATRVNAQGLVENVQILSSNLVQNGDFSEEGAEEVSNGSFSQEGVEELANSNFTNGLTSWNGSGYTVVNNQLIANSTGLLYQPLSLTANKTYKAEINIESISQGGVKFYCQGNQSATITTSGVHTIYIVSGSSNSLVGINPIGTLEAVVNSISFREVGQDWTLGTGWSIGENKITSNASGLLQQSTSVLTAGKTYKTSFEITEYTSGGVKLYSGSGSDTPSYQTSLGTHVVYFVANGNTTSLYSNSFVGSITNISVKEVGMDWEFNSTAILTANGMNIITGGFIRQDVVTIGKSYKLTYDIVSYTSGNIRVYDGTDQGSIPTSVGSNTFNFTAGGSVFIIQSNSANVNLVITNISVIEITDDTNLPRISYENFSYQDALGSELIVNGGFDSDTAWGKINATISGGKGNLNGTGVTSMLYQDVLTNGSTYKATFTISNYNGLGEARMIDSSGAAIYTITSNGTFTITFTHTNASGNIYWRARNSSIFSIDNVSVKEYLGQEVVPNSGCGSWLFEMQSTNLITQSELFSDATWTKVGGGAADDTIITDNYATSPDGTNNASRAQFNAVGTANGDRANLYANINVTSGETFTMSFYGKSATATDEEVVLRMGSVQQVSVTLTQEYQRFSHTYTVTSSGAKNFGIQIRGNSAVTTADIIIWGFQVEALSYATSYIPTSGSTVTRNQDVCNNGGSLATINSTEGVLYAEIAALSENFTNRRFITLNDGTSSNGVVLRYETSGVIIARYQIGGVAQCQLSFATTITDTKKIAFKFSENDFALWVNGVEVATDLSGSVLGQGVLNNCDFNSGNGTFPFYGKTKALAVWKEALSDQELTELTTI